MPVKSISITDKAARNTREGVQGLYLTPGSIDYDFCTFVCCYMNESSL